MLSFCHRNYTNDILVLDPDIPIIPFYTACRGLVLTLLHLHYIYVLHAVTMPSGYDLAPNTLILVIVEMYLELKNRSEHLVQTEKQWYFLKR